MMFFTDVLYEKKGIFLNFSKTGLICRRMKDFLSTDK